MGMKLIGNGNGMGDNENAESHARASLLCVHISQVNEAVQQLHSFAQGDYMGLFLQNTGIHVYH